MQKLITEGNIDILLTSFYELMTTLGLVAKERRASNEKYFLRHNNCFKRSVIPR